MRKIISVLLLVSASVPVFAGPPPLPEPGTLSLFGIGALGLLLTARKNKK